MFLTHWFNLFWQCSTDLTQMTTNHSQDFVIVSTSHLSHAMSPDWHTIRIMCDQQWSLNIHEHLYPQLQSPTERPTGGCRPNLQEVHAPKTFIHLQYNSNPQSLFRIYHLLSCAFLSPCPSLFVCLSLVRLQSTLRCCSLQIHQSQLLKLHPLCCTTSTRQTHARHRSIQRPDIQHAYVCMCVPLLPRSPHPSSPLS